MRTWPRCRRRSFGTTCPTPPTLRAVPKARVLAAALGITRTNWHYLRRQLLTGVRTAPAQLRATTQWGALYDVAINVTGPAGRMHRVRTGWIIRAGEDQPQLLTAYVDLP